MLKIHETTTEQGLAPIYLSVCEDVLEISSQEGAFPLPEGALDSVMARYGAPLDPTIPVVRVATLSLGARDALVHVRHLARWDVIARDYLVYEREGFAPVCALATTIAGALQHLGRAFAQRNL